MRLLVTGGCGFVGSNFVRYVLRHYGPEMVTNVDALTTGRLVNLAGVAESYGERYEFLHADIADADKIEAVLAKHHYFAVIHFAAEASDAVGTCALLDRARRHGVRRFLLVSREAAQGALAVEETAALKRVREHDQEVVIARATANYGPFQPPTEFIPNVIIHAIRDQSAPVPGDGLRTRDWLHVEDHCAALFATLLDGRPGGIYRFSAGHPLRDIDVAHRILEHFGRSRESVALLGDAQEPPPQKNAPEACEPEQLAWKPRESSEQGLRTTIEWYVRNREWWEQAADR